MDVLQFFLAVIFATRVASLKIITVEQTVTALAGEDVTILCEIENLGADDLVLWGNGSKVISNGRNTYGENRIFITGSGEIYDLEIRSVTIYDDGVYICQVPSAGITIRNTLTVNVRPSVELMPDLPMIQLEVGSHQDIRCIGTGKPLPNVTWTKNGENLPPQFIHTAPQMALLMLDDTQKGDTGDYVCTARNGAADAAKKQIRLEVIYKPLVSTPADVISTGLGADVTIECTFDANPPVQVTWLHNGTMIRYEERANVALQHDERAATAGADDRWTLRITDVRPLDLGTYLCEGINQLGPSYREIQLTATPVNLTIVSSPNGKWSDQYKLSWSVQSVPKIIRYDLRLREVNISAPHSFARWRSSKLLSAGGQRGAGAVVRDSHALTGLDVNSTYVIKIRARNSFGDGQWTPEFRFRTSNEVQLGPPRKRGGADADDDDKYVSTATSMQLCHLLVILLGLAGILLV